MPEVTRIAEAMRTLASLRPVLLSEPEDVRARKTLYHDDERVTVGLTLEEVEPGKLAWHLSVSRRDGQAPVDEDADFWLGFVAQVGEVQLRQDVPGPPRYVRHYWMFGESGDAGTAQ